MSRKKPRRRTEEERAYPKFPKAKTPNVKESEFKKEPLTELDVEHIRALMHNAVMWCDRDGGTVLDKGSHPFQSRLSMENIKGKVAAGFTYTSSPYSNGYLEVFVWQERELVLCATDIPGPVYQYPSKEVRVTTYKSGEWEEFLLTKGYKNEQAK